VADLALIIMFAVPSTVIGVGLIGVWNRPGPAAFFYTSPAIIVVGYLARFLPVAALILAANVRQISRSFEEAAEVAGAGWLRTFARIVIPQMSAGIVAAWVVSFIFAFGELGATILVAPPGESTLPVRLYTLIANAPSAEVAALALMQAGIVLVPLALFSIFASHEGRGL
jgi:iron(III) transport system permease protein